MTPLQKQAQEAARWLRDTKGAEVRQQGAYLIRFPHQKESGRYNLGAVILLAKSKGWRAADSLPG